MIKAVPYKIHTVLTDNGIQFCDMPQNRSGPTARYRLHMFDRICREHGIEHRLTKPNHPWTNGQVERMNRTLKEATVRRYHYDTHTSSRAPCCLPRCLQLRQATQDPHAASLPTKPSAKHGQTNHIDSDTIRPTSLRD